MRSVGGRNDLAGDGNWGWGQEVLDPDRQISHAKETDRYGYRRSRLDTSTTDATDANRLGAGCGHSEAKARRWREERGQRP